MRVKYYMRGIGVGIILTVIVCSFGNKQTKQTMSDNEIIEAAKELGMVMKDENELDLSILKGTVTPIPENKNESLISITPEPTKGLEETVSPYPTEGTQNEVSQESANEVQEGDSETKLIEETNEIKEGDSETKPIEETNEIKESDSETKPIEVTESLDTTKDKIENENAEVPSPTSVATELREFQIKSGMGSEAVAKVIEEAGLIDDWEEFNRYLISNNYSSKIRTNNYSLPLGVGFKEIAEKITKKP